MLVLIDKYIPYINGLLEPYCTVEYLEPEEFTPQRVMKADAMLIRTRTRCNEGLLCSSNVKFIATATIGYDHIDTAYCERNDIAWTNSPGCNAQGVCDYVDSAIEYAIRCGKIDNTQDITLGVVGVGHVGRLVKEMALQKGFRVLLNDPPRAAKEGNDEFVDLETIAKECDIITFHTPLTRKGDYPSFHLADRQFLQLCKRDVLIINAARGGVLDEQVALLEENDKKTFIIDTWEGEPKINIDMLNRSLIGTYHIAGYTIQGKVNATNMCLSALCRHFGLPLIQVPKSRIPTSPALAQDWQKIIDSQLRADYLNFEYLRETYPLR